MLKTGPAMPAKILQLTGSALQEETPKAGLVMCDALSANSCANSELRYACVFHASIAWVGAQLSNVGAISTGHVM